MANSCVSCTGGTTARPHCLTDAMTVRSQRSWRPPFAHGLHRHIGPPAHKWLHGRHTQHDGVADDAVHLVALEQRLRQRHARRAVRQPRCAARLDVHADTPRRNRRRHAPAPRVPGRRKSRPSLQAEAEARAPDAALRRPAGAPRRIGGKIGRVEPMHALRIRTTRLPTPTRPAQSDSQPRLYTAVQCFSVVRPSESTKSCRLSAAADSAPFTSPKTPGSTRRSRSRCPHRQNVDFGDLLREPRLLASLNHPNIVSILTAEKQDNIFFIVMEYVPGDTLETVISRDGTHRSCAHARLHLPDLQRLDHAHQQRRHSSRSAAGQRPGDRGRALEGRRLRHVALHRDRGARHDGDRQPAVHGARTVSRQDRVCLGHLLARRDDVPDVDRRAAVQHAGAGRPREADEGRARLAAAHAEPENSGEASTTSS